VDHKHLEQMRTIAAGDDSSNPLENYDADMARAIIYLLEKRVEDLARARAHHDEFNDLKRRVEDLERKLQGT
jgi:hypothetical protein